MNTPMKKTALLLTLCAIVSLTAVAQQPSFEDFTRERLQKLQQMQDDFNKFVEERDKKFAEYLQRDFREFQPEPSVRPTDAPKPVDFPTYDQQPSDRNRQYEIDTTTQSYERSRGLLIPPSTKEETENYSRSASGVQFYGNKFTLQYDQRLKLPDYDRYEAETISQAWLLLSQAQVRSLLNQLYRYKNTLSLNDWGFFQLVQQFASGLYGSDDPRAELTTWFLLNKARYKVKLGYQNDQLYLLLPSNSAVYSATYYSFNNGERYYLFGTAPESLFTYPDDYAGADQALNMEMSSPLNLGGVVQKKIFTFLYEGQTYELPLEYNPQAMSFYQNYPAVELQTKMESNLSREAKESLLTQFQPLLDGRTERDQVGLLLRFVQTAFAYKMDQEQFGTEKYFFPEEVLHYAYSDCEDRAALFAYLVRQLLSLKVVCLNYPGHVATAVRLTGAGEGDYIMLKGEKYTICDPTYINAPVGKSMDRFAHVKAQVIQLQDPYRKLKKEAVWAAATSFGGYPASGSNNVVIDRDDNIYFTGYLLGGNGSQGLDMFVAKITSQGDLAWLERATGAGSNTGNYIALDAHQDVYVAGRYEHDIRFADNARLKSDLSSFFVTKYSPEGKVRWAKDVPIDVTSNSLQNTFAAQINDQGEVVEAVLFYGAYAERGISVDSRGHVYFMGDLPADAEYSNSRSFGVVGIDSATETLEQASNALKTEQYDPAIVGLFAVIRCINKNGASLSGKVAQQTLDRYNPTFKESSPKIYANIGRLAFMKNQSGIVTITSEDGKPVDFDKMRIEDDARVRVQTFADGNAQMDVLSGMTVGRSIIRFRLNYVRLFKDDGNLLLDYDSDNTQMVMNLANDILY